MSYLRTSHAGARLRWAGLFGLIAALSLCLTPGIADAAKKGKKKNQVRILSQNLYLGSDLDPVVAAANARRGGCHGTGRHSGEAEGGRQLRQRGRLRPQGRPGERLHRQGADDRQADQEEQGRSGRSSGGRPLADRDPDRRRRAAERHFRPRAADRLHRRPAERSSTRRPGRKKQCNKRGLKGNKCYRGYRLVLAQQEADIEQPGDFDNDPGPNGIGGTGPAFDTTPPFPRDETAGPIPAGYKPGPPCQNGWFNGQPGEALNDPETNPGGDDTGVFAQDPGPPNDGTTPASFDPVTGELTLFDFNGDSSSNFQNNGAPPSSL